MLLFNPLVVLKKKNKRCNPMLRFINPMLSIVKKKRKKGNPMLQFYQPYVDLI